MYQQNTKVDLSFLGDNPEEQFEKLISIFKESLNVDKIKLEQDNTEWDLSKRYLINWACIWNKIKNINRDCRIVQKNSELALIMFIDDTTITSDKIYRLEDLTLIPN